MPCYLLALLRSPERDVSPAMRLHSLLRSMLTPCFPYATKKDVGSSPTRTARFPAVPRSALPAHCFPEVKILLRAETHVATCYDALLPATIQPLLHAYCLFSTIRTNFRGSGVLPLVADHFVSAIGRLQASSTRHASCAPRPPATYTARGFAATLRYYSMLDGSCATYVDDTAVGRKCAPVICVTVVRKLTA